jgi:DNA-binding CsgD family transcriptional regulator
MEDLILQYLKEGKTQAEIADLLKDAGIKPNSLSSVEKKLKSIREKYGARSMFHLAVILQSQLSRQLVWAIVNLDAEDLGSAVISTYWDEARARQDLEVIESGDNEEYSPAGAYDVFSFDLPAIAQNADKELKYLQDMTKEDFVLIFKHSDFSFHIPEFKTLYGWAKGISMFGNFGSWDKAKELGYDVNFTLPMKG